MYIFRTLYVAGLQKTLYNSIGSLEEALKRHFIEWGEIEEAKIIPRLSIGFVRYRLRTSSGEICVHPIKYTIFFKSCYILIQFTRKI